MLFIKSALLGWVATLLLAVGASIPYLVRGATIPDTSDNKRLWPHFWIGFLIPAVALAHAWLPMAAGHMRGYNLSGLWIATLALVIMIGQAALGLALRGSQGAERRT